MRARDLCGGLAGVAMAVGLVACGGGADAPVGAGSGAGAGGGAGALASTQASAQVLAAQPRQRAAKVSGTAGDVLALHQALYGKAPGYQQYNTLITQATADPVAFMAAEAAPLAALSDSALATQVLANMNVSAATIGSANYTSLRDIVAQLLGIYGPSLRGAIVVNLTNILAGLEADATYGAAAIGFNAQVMVNFNYSVSTASLTEQVVAPPRLSTGLAQGLYTGTMGTQNNSFNLLMLENDVGYALYGQMSGNLQQINGMIRMEGISTVQSYGSANVRDYTSAGTLLNYTMGATFSPGASFTGSFGTGSGGTINFSSGGVSASLYNYNSPAQLASITGAWPGSLLNGSAGTLTINANGSFSGSLSGCTLSGTLVARPSGKNVFNLNATFGATNCLTPNAAVSGVAISYTTSAGQKQLLMTMTTPGDNQGSVFLALR